MPRPVVDPALLNATDATRWTNLGWWEAPTSSPAHPTSYADAARGLAQRVGEAARLRPGDVVVDMACGYGDSLALWVSAFGAARVVGVEPNPVVAAAVRARIAAWGLADRITVVPATAETFDLAEHAADATAVVCVDAAYHFRTRAAWLRAIARAAAPGLGSGSAIWRARVRGRCGAPTDPVGGGRVRGAAHAAVGRVAGRDPSRESLGPRRHRRRDGRGRLRRDHDDGGWRANPRRVQAFARRSRSVWLRRPRTGGWHALATAWLLGRVRPGLTMVCIGARVR